MRDTLRLSEALDKILNKPPTTTLDKSEKNSMEWIVGSVGIVLIVFLGYQKFLR